MAKQPPKIKARSAVSKLSGRNFSNLRVGNKPKIGRFSGNMDPAAYRKMMAEKHGDPIADAQKASSFVSGGRKMGAGINASAKSNIVKFDRNTTVRPVTPNVGILLKTISSNILSDIDNAAETTKLRNDKPRDQKVVNVYNNQVQEIKKGANNKITNIQNVVQKFSSGSRTLVNQLATNYKRKIEDVDSAKPAGILKKFLDSFKNALGFVQFFNNPTNTRRISASLKAARNSFGQIFGAAVALRTIIAKIYDTLSKAPNLSGMGGGMRVPLPGRIPGRAPNLPGRTPPRRGMVRPRGRMRTRNKLGLGLLGAGLLGGGLMAGSAQAAPMPPPPIAPPPIPEDFSSIFGSAVDRFAESIKALFKKQEEGKEASSSPTSSSSPSSGSASPPSSPGSMSLGGPVSTNEEAALLKTIRDVEGTAGEDGYGKVFGGEVVPELAKGEMTINEVIQMQNTGYMPKRLGGRKVNYGTFFDKSSGTTRSSAASGAYQFMPATLGEIADRTGVDRSAKLTPELQDQLGLALARQRNVDPKQRATLQSMTTLGGVWAGLTPQYQQTDRTAAESLAIYNRYLSQPQQMMGPPVVIPDQTRAQETSTVSQSIARVPISQDGSQQPAIVPMPMPSPQQPSQKIAMNGGKKAQDDGVPHLSTSDPSNFQTMYSKMIYNIV